jgi:hypothetical protein
MMKKSMIIRIDEHTKNKFDRIARIEGKTTSEKVRELMSSYVATNDLSSIVDSLWSRISDKIKQKGYNEKDVENLIKEARDNKKDLT